MNRAIRCDRDSCSATVTFSPPVTDAEARAAVRALGWSAVETSPLQHCPRCREPEEAPATFVSTVLTIDEVKALLAKGAEESRAARGLRPVRRGRRL